MSFDRVQFRSPETPTSVEGGQAQTDTDRLHTLMTPEAAMGKSRSQKAEGSNMVSGKIVAGVLAVVVLLGVGVGYVGSRASGSMMTASPKIETAKTAADVASAIKVGAVFGSADTATFKDDVEGVLIKGGIGGEGSHTLLREGGKSQNVYLTSSVVDLDQFVNMKVHVWGETFKGQKAGWLMDIGRLEVKDLSPEKPSWYTPAK